MWTWLYHRAGGSVLFAVFVHANNNISTGFVAGLLSLPASDARPPGL